MIFLLCKIVSKLVIIVTNNFLSLKLVTNKTFSCSEILGDRSDGGDAAV